MAKEFNEKTQVGNRMVSTVSLAVRHIGGQYESMVFACDDDGEITNWLEQEMDRYETAEAARAGHAAIVARLRQEDEETSDAAL